MRYGGGQLKALVSYAWYPQPRHAALAARRSSKLMGKSVRLHSTAGGGVTLGGGFRRGGVVWGLVSGYAGVRVCGCVSAHPLAEQVYL
jgi:hypothetical protein